MKFKGVLIRTLLRILTPEEIADLTISSAGKRKVNLSLLLKSSMTGANYKEVMEEEQKLDDHDDDGSKQALSEAKILSFDTEGQTDKKLNLQVGQRVHLLLEQYGNVFREMDKKVMGAKRFPKKRGLVSRKPTSALILEQKQKLHASYSKIKSMEVLSLYKSSSAVEITKKVDEEDFSFSSRLGVLVNKKQA